MTQLSTPTTTLIRIPFSGLTDFHPQALAPGLPMLDVNKLTYQILLGWFGDLLAEPELDDEGVMFHAQRSGIRQTIVERALATSEDLHGSLQPQYEKLKNALFDVRPVSPSERLIFNRMQPPIGNHEGFLYRVLTESGDEQLVWCWGFQRRTQYGDARLCSNTECSMLFLHDSLAEPLCPHCGTSFSAAIENARSTSSKFPIGKASAAAAALLLAGGTFWFSSDQTDLSADTITDVADLDHSAPKTAPASRTNPAPYDDLASSETPNTNKNNKNEVSRKSQELNWLMPAPQLPLTPKLSLTPQNCRPRSLKRHRPSRRSCSSGSTMFPTSTNQPPAMTRSRTLQNRHSPNQRFRLLPHCPTFLTASNLSTTAQRNRKIQRNRLSKLPSRSRRFRPSKPTVFHRTKPTKLRNCRTFCPSRW